MKSIIQHLGTSDFIRIRVGVGEKPEGWDLADHVLSRIPEQEYKLISKQFEYIQRAIGCIFSDGIERAMSVFNPIGSNKQI